MIIQQLAQLNPTGAETKTLFVNLINRVNVLLRDASQILKLSSSYLQHFSGTRKLTFSFTPHIPLNTVSPIRPLQIYGCEPNECFDPPLGAIYDDLRCREWPNGQHQRPFGLFIRSNGHGMNFTEPIFFLVFETGGKGRSNMSQRCLTETEL